MAIQSHCLKFDDIVQPVSKLDSMPYLKLRTHENVFNIFVVLLS